MFEENYKIIGIPLKEIMEKFGLDESVIDCKIEVNTEDYVIRIKVDKDTKPCYGQFKGIQHKECADCDDKDDCLEIHGEGGLKEDDDKEK